MAYQTAALEAHLYLAGAGAAIAVLVVSVIALLVVVGENDAVPAAGLAAVLAADGLHFTIRIATIANDVVAIVAGFVAFLFAIPADRLFATAAEGWTDESEFSFAGVRAAVATGRHRIAVFALFLAG